MVLLGSTIWKQQECRTILRNVQQQFSYKTKYVLSSAKQRLLDTENKQILAVYQNNLL